MIIKISLKSIFIAGILLLAGCASIPNPYRFGEVSEDVKAITAQTEIAETQLLDVSIKIFEPGTIPEDKEDSIGLSQEIRNSEARYMPIHLKYTMQRTGYWGNVRVVPDDNEGSDVLVKGEIVESDGEVIKIKINVKDSRNKQWFEKEYKQTVSFSEHTTTEQEKKDIFQNIYTQISNDIINYRIELTQADILKIKQTAELQFAQYMAPETFDEYLLENSKGEYEIVKLPSVDDPMMIRVRSIKSRNDLLIDTINNYYNIYYNDIWESYENWRKFRSEELGNIREIERKALTQKLIGAAAIIGAIALGASSNSEVRDRTGALRTVMIAGGTYGLYSGFKTSKETEINKEVIEELGTSFATEVEPMTIEVSGKTMKLTGSAEQQYTKWRELLNEIYRQETGFNQ